MWVLWKVSDVEYRRVVKIGSHHTEIGSIGSFADGRYIALINVDVEDIIVTPSPLPWLTLVD